MIGDNESHPNIPAGGPGGAPSVKSPYPQGGYRPRRRETKTYKVGESMPADAGVLGTQSGEPPATSAKPTDGKLSDADLKEFFSTVFQLADQVRRPHEIRWRLYWDQYNGVRDWSSKAWWQSKANIPKCRATVDRACALFRKSLLRLRQFYQIQSESKTGKRKGAFTGQLLDYWFEQTGIIDELTAAMKNGLITSVIALKVWWQQVREDVPIIEETPIEEPVMEFGVQTGVRKSTKKSVKFKGKTRGKLAVKAIDSFNIWVVPKTNGGGKIERTYATLDEIAGLAEKGVYEKDAVKRIENWLGASDNMKETQEARRKGELPPTHDRYIRQFELFHYWGDIYDKEGRVVAPNASFTMVGKEVVIRRPRTNPFLHKKPPYVMGTAYVVPFSNYHRGMVEDGYEIIEEFIELVNCVLDGAKYDACKAFTLDVDQLDDPKDASDGIYPGVTKLRRSSQAPPGAKLIDTIDVGHVPEGAMNALAMLNSAHQEATYVNEWVEGMGGKGDRTLGEVTIKTQAALEGLDEAARNIESTVIEPLLDLAAKTIYQFHTDYSLPRLVENYPETAALMEELEPSERYAIMVGGYEFKARGLSVMIDQQQRMGDIMQFLTLLSHIPGLMEQINPVELLEVIMMPLNWNPDRLILKGGPMNSMGLGAPAAGAGGAGASAGRTPAQDFSARQGAMTGGAINNPTTAGAPNPSMNPVASQLMKLIQGGRR